MSSVSSSMFRSMIPSAGWPSFARSRGQISVLVHTAGLSPVQASARAIVQVDLLGTAHVLDTFGAVIAEGGPE
jgi:hypothetical protein